VGDEGREGSVVGSLQIFWFSANPKIPRLALALQTSVGRSPWL